MKNFGPLITDTLPIKLPLGGWNRAKNIITNKKLNTISNEPSHKLIEQKSLIPLGEISTAKDIVYLGVASSGESVIYRQKLNTEDTSINLVIKTEYLSFKKNCPIEGIATYNYLGELIITFCDGIFENSNSPKVINLDNLPVELDGNKELVNPENVNRLEMFPNIQEGNLSLTYLQSGAIEGLFAYITYCYVFNDGSTTAYFPVSNVAYLGEGADPVDKRGVRLSFSKLDASFSKLRIGLVIKNDSNLVGYESYDISYTGTTKTIDITSLSSYESTAAENIVLNKIVFNKIETITKQNNRVVVGKYSTKPEIPLQKYFCNLKLTPYKYLDISSLPSLMPDEVYSFYGQVQWKDGTYSQAFHIPGREATGTEKNSLDASFISTWGLSWTGQYSEFNWKQFHFNNTGKAFNNNAANSFGFWENESEFYPNNDEYNGSKDYDNSNIPNGRDLRNKNIKYHRIPGLDQMALSNEGNALGGYNTGNRIQYYKIGVRVENFMEVFPDEIKDQIQGYRICFVKRNIGDTLISGNWAATRRGSNDWTQAGVDITYEYYNFNRTDSTDDSVFGDQDVKFDKLRIVSPELFKLRPNLDITFIKSNFLFRTDEESSQLIVSNVQDRYAPIKEKLKYVPGNNLAANTQYLEEGINLDLDTTDYLLNTTAIEAKYYALNLSAISFKTNLYAGFKTSNLVVMGRSSNLTTKSVIKGGDVFNDNFMNLHLHYAGADYLSSNRIVLKRQYHYLPIGGLFSPINSILVENEEPSRKSEDLTIGDNERPERIDENYLFSNDYDFDIKNEDDLSSLNDINVILSFDPNDNFINTFLYRFHRGISLGKESLNTNGLRTFLSDEYYEITNDKGDLVALRGSDRALYIQYENSLFIALLKDKLRTNNVDAFLGEVDILEREPEEVLPDGKGTIGSVSKSSCKVIRSMYITINAIDGQIFIIKGGVTEITQLGNSEWFRDNWDIGLTYYNIHPITKQKIRIDHLSIAGYGIGYDERYKRLFFSKRFFKPLSAVYNTSLYKFDGNFFSLKSSDNAILNPYDSTLFKNESFTLSFSLTENEWICWHDFTTASYIHTPNKLLNLKINPSLFSFWVYEHNDTEDVGLYQGERHESYVDLVFNSNSEITKKYQSIKVISEAIKNNRHYKDITIDKIVVYNNSQCSGEIDLKLLTREANGEFNFNEFRDLVKKSDQPIINEDGTVNHANINYDKLWFERSYFISKFIVVRLIMSNLNSTNIYINEVNVNSTISKR